VSLIENILENLLDPTTLPGALFYALIFFGAALLVARLARIFAKRSARHFSDLTAIHFVAQLLQVVVFLIALILYAQLIPALRSLGTALLAGVSVTAIVLGLAAQNTLSNLIAGFSLLLYRPFHVGDQVELNTPKGVQTGTVYSLSLGYTVLINAEKEEIIVPNSVMVSQVIIRLAHGHEWKSGD
jgi:small-conductance mechanosensitive channel